MPGLPSVRLLVARHRRAVRFCQALGVAAVAIALTSGLRSIDDARKAWGETTDVLVTRHALSPGDDVGTDDVRVVAWPVALVPDRATHRTAQLGVVRHRVGPGEVLTLDDVGAAPGPAGLLPAGASGVVVPVGPDVLGLLAVGDIVGIVVAGTDVATGPVVRLGDAAVTVASRRAAHRPSPMRRCSAQSASCSSPRVDQRAPLTTSPRTTTPRAMRYTTKGAKLRVRMRRRVPHTANKGR